MHRHQGIRRYVKLIMTFTAGLWLTCGMLFAETQYGSVTGHAYDKSQAILPGVTVTLTGNGAPQTFVTDPQGQFRFLNLAAGRYTVTGELAGMGKATHTNVEVTVGNNTEIDLTLNPSVAESITVTAASPIIDRRQNGTAVNLQEIELKEVPTARDPWVMLQSVPGVLVDRVNVGGNKSGQQSYFVGKGVERNQTAWNLDGVNVSDMQATGTSGFYYDFDSFKEFSVSTGSADPSVQTPGVQINMVTKRGTNDLRGSGRWLFTDQSFQANPSVPAETAHYATPFTQVNSIDRIDDYGVELGGPIMRDRLWLWGAYSKNDINNLVPGTTLGLFQKTELKNYNAKINAQVTDANSANLYWMYSDKIQIHRGINPVSRPDVATSQNQSGPGWVYKAEDTQMFGSSLYLTGKVGLIHNGYTLTPVGGLGTNVFWDNEGSIPHGSYRFYDQKVPQQTYRADGSKFFSTAAANHELKFGFGYRNTPVTSITAWPGDKTWTEYYEDPGNNRVAITRDAVPSYGSKYTDVYAGDTILLGNLTVNAGLRYDLQKAQNKASTVAANPAFPDLMPSVTFAGDAKALQWKSVSPRLGLTYALGSDKKTLLRAGYSRYADQLGSGEVGPNNPFYNPQVLYFYWSDLNKDRKVQRNEIGDFSDAIGVDPAHPASPVSTGRIDYSMKPPKTDELTFGVERELLSAFAVGVNATYRKRTDFIWTQYEKTRGAGDYYTTADYAPSARSSVSPQVGTLPNGDPYNVIVYALKSGVPSPVFTVTRNRPDYDQTYKGLELTATKRMENNWMLRGNVTLTDWKQHVGANAIVDPTPVINTPGGSLFMGCFSCTGSSAVASASGEDGFINSRWSAALNGVYQFPYAITVGAAFTARDGYIIPYNRRINARDGFGNKRVLIGGFDDNRLDNLYQLDLRLAKSLTLARGPSIEFSADLFNAMNARTVLWRDYRLYSLNGSDLSSGTNNIVEMQSPRIWRFGARLTF
jgi:hypothetical protein